MDATTSPDIGAADIALLDLLRRLSTQSIADLATAMGVTATAVRQRLTRLMAQGYVQRAVVREGRGRPRHRYELTPLGHRKAGANFADLAMALWEEIRRIPDPTVRQGLLQRISARLAASYADSVTGRTLQERMESLAALFTARRIPFEVEMRQELPVLKAMSCPYPDLAEQDRAVCAMERMLFSELAGETLRLEECRLNGQSCCSFVPSRN